MGGLKFLKTSKKIVKLLLLKAAQQISTLFIEGCRSKALPFLCIVPIPLAGSMTLYDAQKAWMVLSAGLIGSTFLLVCHRVVRCAAAAEQKAALHGYALTEGSQINDEASDEGDASHSSGLNEDSKILPLHEEAFEVEMVRRLREHQEAYEMLHQAFESRERELQELRRHCDEKVSMLTAQLQQQQGLVDEYRLQDKQQQEDIVRQEEMIANLENQIHELTYQLQDQSYEIKTLLQLAELQTTGLSMAPTPALPYGSLQKSTEIKKRSSSAAPPIHDAQQLLRRCLDIARKFSGPTFYSHTPLTRGHPLQANHALDLQRLRENLSAEQQASLLLYSPNEEKLLFATPAVTAMIGWSLEQLMEDFYHILGNEGTQAWRRGLEKLQQQMDCALPLCITTPTKEKLDITCTLARIPTGIFRHLVIAILTVK